MRQSGPLLKVVVLFFLIFAGSLVASLIVFAIAMSSGIDMQDMISQLGSGELTDRGGLLKIMLVSQHLAMFIIPAVIFGFIFYGKQWFRGFDLSSMPTILLCVLGCAFLAFGYPLVNLSFMLNEAIPLPGWATQMEDQVAGTLENILGMENIAGLIVNLLVIALMPAIGEELIFRAGFQKYFGKLVKSPIAGIWIAAIIFSAIHFQFEGFLPRMVLGLLLGYLYYWTKNLWVPVVVHFFNNGLQVVIFYFTSEDFSQIDPADSGIITWWSLLISIALMFGAAQLIQNNVEENAKA